MITNLQLVKYCEAMLGEAYWWGTFNNKCTQALYETKKKQYPSYYDQKKYRVSFADQIKKGMKCTDCIGLIKGAIWCNGDKNSTPKYVANQDVNVGGMLNLCKEKGKIKTLPEIAGILVFKSGHVGVYVGNGWVIEAKGHDYGVVRTKLSDTPWTDWGKCPWIEYATANTPTTNKAPSTTVDPTKKSIEQVAKDVIGGKYGNGSTRKKKLEAEGYDYNEVQAMVNKLCNDKSLWVGRKVKIKTGAKTYDGKKVALWVYVKSYTVDEINGDRVVLDKKGICTAFNAKDLIAQ